MEAYERGEIESARTIRAAIIAGAAVISIIAMSSAACTARQSIEATKRWEAHQWEGPTRGPFEGANGGAW